MNTLRQDVKASFARQQIDVGELDEARARLIERVLASSPPRRRFLPQLAGAAATLLLAVMVAAAILLTRGHLRQAPQAQSLTLEQALSAGPAAEMPAAQRGYIWLTGPITGAPQGTPNGSYAVIGTTIRVMDWTGKVRYHFDLPKATAPGPVAIQAISADGTRALLDDGTVLDQTGVVVDRIPALRVNGMPGGTVHWMSDNSGICAAFSNEPMPQPGPSRVKGQPNPSPTAAPPFTAIGADHSVTLKVFRLNGQVRTVATVGRELLTSSGPFGDSTSVLACSPRTDLAILARYHDADTDPTHTSSTNMTVSLWAIKLSTGEVLFHQPDTRMALGRAFFYGSQNATLDVEFLWNSKYSGSEIDSVLQMPSGRQVTVVDDEPSDTDTPGLSADGTRILRRVIDKTGTHTSLELIDASNGRIIRKVTVPGIFGASAVAQPGGSGFIVQVQQYLAFVDGNGGITLLHPGFTIGQGGPASVGLSGMPGLQS